MKQIPIKMRADAAFDPWEDRAKEVLNREMGNRKMTYKELSLRLQAFGIEESPDQINRKVNRKRFSAAFMFACLAAMEVESIGVPSQLALPPAKPISWV